MYIFIHITFIIKTTFYKLSKFDKDNFIHLFIYFKNKYTKKNHNIDTWTHKTCTSKCYIVCVCVLCIIIPIKQNQKRNNKCLCFDFDFDLKFDCSRIFTKPCRRNFFNLAFCSSIIYINMRNPSLFLLWYAI